jgi:bifunctional UDP-N-acetylglucosamine pyrophosphorylase/glucosamine-1-phosphate N-acetyltransferase
MLQAVILAAGRSTRTYPLTTTRPKPLIPILGKPLLELVLEQLSGWVDEAILVVGYRSESIRQRLGDRFGSLPLRYFEQTEQRGTADALQKATPLIRDRCLVLNGDDLYHRHDLEALVRHPTAILVTPAPDPKNRAVVSVERDRVVDIVEKPASAPSNALCSVGGYALERESLERLTQVQLSGRGELELPDFIRLLAGTSVVRYHRIERYWLPLTYSWDVLRATIFLLEEPGRAREFGVEVPGRGQLGQLAQGGDIELGTGTTVEGPVLIAPGAILGSHCHLRGPAVIGEGCRLGDGVEVERSVLFGGVRVSDFARISHSVLGELVRIGSRASLLSEPTPGQVIEVDVQGKKIATRLEQLGLIAGDEASVPDQTQVPPGRLLAAGDTYRQG